MKSHHCIISETLLVECLVILTILCHKCVDLFAVYSCLGNLKILSLGRNNIKNLNGLVSLLEQSLLWVKGVCFGILGAFIL